MDANPPVGLASPQAIVEAPSRPLHGQRALIGPQTREPALKRVFRDSPRTRQPRQRAGRGGSPLTTPALISGRLPWGKKEISAACTRYMARRRSPARDRRPARDRQASGLNARQGAGSAARERGLSASQSDTSVCRNDTGGRPAPPAYRVGRPRRPVDPAALGSPLKKTGKAPCPTSFWSSTSSCRVATCCCKRSGRLSPIGCWAGGGAPISRRSATRRR